jgi:PilZ domain-containing protein
MSSTAEDSRDTPWIERRTRNRFRLVLPVVFHWNDGTERSGVGYCRNIGLGGLFIIASSCPPVDTELRIDVVVPAFDPEPKEILFHHTGQVVRIQAAEELFGFAVAGQFKDDNTLQARLKARTFGKQ